ncbi:MAG: hypothetical protein K1X77_09325 [Bacteroidia bacterium]|nr:hypothetical protein [Bacteroidia bacterium]
MAKKRHLFWFISGCGTLLLSALLLLSGCYKENLAPYTYPEKAVVIKEILLDCQQSQLSKQAFFWNQIMGFELVASSATGFSVMVGNSKLTFRKGQTGYGGIYNFTLDVPENQIESVRLWVLKRSGIVPNAETNAEIQHKSKLNAHSLYFRDPVGNLIECIARHDLANAREGEFDQTMFTGISNVSVVTRNVKDCGDTLYKYFQYAGVDGTSNSVKLVGGNSGTLTLHIPTRPFFPTEDIVAFPYRIEIVISNPSNQAFKLPGTETFIRSEP